MFKAIAGAVALAVVSAGACSQDLLDPDAAFRTTARWIKPGLIEVRYQTARGYYLYRDRLAFALEPADAVPGPVQLPPGKFKSDEFFGKSVIYRNRTTVRVPVVGATDQPLTLIADLQGCADIGVCYPPVRRKLPLSPVSTGK